MDCWIVRDWSRDLLGKFASDFTAGFGIATAPNCAQASIALLMGKCGQLASSTGATIRIHTVPFVMCVRSFELGVQKLLCCSLYSALTSLF